jgi:hypothetical protein
VKFLRHLGAATAVVAIVVLAGLAWNHFWPSTLVGQLPTGGPQIFAHGVRVGPVVQLAGPPPGHGHPPSGPRIVKLPGGRGFGIVSGPGVSAFYGLLRAVNLRVLEDTAKVEAEFIAAVVIIDVIRRRLRRHHRARRAAQSEPPAVPSGT